MSSSPPPNPKLFAPQTVFDYHRTVVGFHGTRKAAAARLVDGEAFDHSTNDDDWLGHGIYFWEYAPQQAWRWAIDRYGEEEAAVVGATIRLGLCLDLLDPANVELVRAAHEDLAVTYAAVNADLPSNANHHKYLDCAVFKYLHGQLDRQGYRYESTRAVFVPMLGGNMPRVWNRSGIFQGGHIQLSLREPRNILALWSVRRDGRYGRDI